MITKKANPLSLNPVLTPLSSSCLCFPSLLLPVGSSPVEVPNLLFHRCVRFVLPLISWSFERIGLGPLHVLSANSMALALALPNDVPIFSLCVGKRPIYSSILAAPLLFSPSTSIRGPLSGSGKSRFCGKISGGAGFSLWRSQSESADLTGRRMLINLIFGADELGWSSMAAGAWFKP